MKKTGERLREMRLKNNLTLLDVAKILNVSEATVQRYESGSIKNLKYDTITALANLFNCSPTYLMGWDDVERFAEPIDSLLSADELTLLGQYRQLDLNDRVKLLEYSITLGLISKGINLKDV